VCPQECRDQYPHNVTMHCLIRSHTPALLLESSRSCTSGSIARPAKKIPSSHKLNISIKQSIGATLLGTPEPCSTQCKSCRCVSRLCTWCAVLPWAGTMYQGHRRAVSDSNTHNQGEHPPNCISRDCKVKNSSRASTTWRQISAVRYTLRDYDKDNDSAKRR
jgi:hypothetical protein